MHAREVVSVATPLLVPIIEEDCVDEAFTIEVLQHYFGPSQLGECDALILGCTHYPMLSQQIASVFGKPIADTPSATAQALKERLTKRDALKQSNEHGSLSIMLTDDADRSLDIVSRRLGIRVTDTRKVDAAELGAH